MKKQQIKSFEHACEVLGLSLDLSKFNELGLPEKDVQPLVDYYKITLIIEANNKLNNWKADFADGNQWKYSPYFWVKANQNKPSGFGFSFADFVSWYTGTDVGSRLLVGTAEEAMYIGTTFIDLFEGAWLIIPQEA